MKRYSLGEDPDFCVSLKYSYVREHTTETSSSLGSCNHTIVTD